MPANEVILFDGFRYEFVEGKLWAEGKPPVDVVTLKLIDDGRGHEAHAVFAREAWDEFARTIAIGRLAVSPGDLRRLRV